MTNDPYPFDPQRASGPEAAAAEYARIEGMLAIVDRMLSGAAPAGPPLPQELVDELQEARTILQAALEQRRETAMKRADGWKGTTRTGEDDE